MWHAKYEHCQGCKTTERKHMAKGFCGRCYLQRYRSDPAKRERVLQQQRDWFFKNYEENLAKSKKAREQRNFDGKRERILKRDGYRCVRCKSKKDLTVHHKDRNGRRSAKPNNRDANLETVCRKCHLTEHRKELIAARMKKHDETHEPILLQSGRWSQKHDACVSCGTTKRRHASRGRCGTCYLRDWKKAHA